MERLAVIDGQLLRGESAVVSVFDRGFLYGDGVFEVLRTKRGVPFLFERHVERLLAGIATLGIQTPMRDRVMNDVSVLLGARQGQETFLRIVVTRGQMRSGIASDADATPMCVVLGEDLVLPTDAMRARGVSMATIRSSTPSSDLPIRSIKSLNYLEQILALRLAKARGADDALLVAANGNVSEGATSNFFVVAGDELLTPPLDSGVLPGVTRSLVIGLASTLTLRPREVEIPLESLAAARECFLTSSIRGAMRVASIDGRPLPDDGVTTRFSELLEAAR